MTYLYEFLQLIHWFIEWHVYMTFFNWLIDLLNDMNQLKKFIEICHSINQHLYEFLQLIDWFIELYVYVNFFDWLIDWFGRLVKKTNRRQSGPPLYGEARRHSDRPWRPIPARDVARINVCCDTGRRKLSSKNFKKTQCRVRFRKKKPPPPKKISSEKSQKNSIKI